MLKRLVKQVFILVNGILTLLDQMVPHSLWPTRRRLLGAHSLCTIWQRFYLVLVIDGSLLVILLVLYLNCRRVWSILRTCVISDLVFETLLILNKRRATFPGIKIIKNRWLLINSQV